MFRFLVDKHQQLVTIHTVLVARQSPTLNALVSGSMGEVETGTARWEDVDEGTFARWAQFMYTGDYTSPSCSTVTEPSTIPNKTSIPREYEWEGS